MGGESARRGKVAKQASFLLCLCVLAIEIPASGAVVTWRYNKRPVESPPQPQARQPSVPDAELTQTSALMSSESGMAGESNSDTDAGEKEDMKSSLPAISMRNNRPEQVDSPMKPGLSPNQYDHIVIGAGIIGSWTAYHLAQKGKSVLLLEQFPLPNTRGSSSGHTRGIEPCHDQVEDIPMILDSYPMWTKLERDAGEKLFDHHDGLLVTESEDGWPIHQIERAIDLPRIHVPKRNLDPVQLKTFYPDIKIPNATAALVDGSAGMLLAAKILNILRTKIVQHGGVVKDMCQVSRVNPGEPFASVQCHRHPDKFFAESVVIAAGSWTQKMLRKLGMEVTVSSVYSAFMYFPVKPGASVTQTMTLHYGPKRSFKGWTHPMLEYPGLVKVGVNLWIPVDPDERDVQDPLPMREAGVKYVKDHFQECLNDTISIYEAYHFYDTEDKKHILGRHPYYPNIIFGAPTGAGFKLSPVFGAALAALATNSEPPIDVSGYTLERFGNNRFRPYNLETRSSK